MTESKEVTSSDVGEASLVTVAGDGPEGDDTTVVVAESSTKSKKKKKKSKLKNLFSKQPLEASALARIEKAIGSATLEDDHSMSKDDQKNLDRAIDKMNQVLPGGKKGLSDHKFWKTQPVVNFDETVDEEGRIKTPEPNLVPRESIKVGGDLEFVDVDMENETQVQEVYELLSGHYVEDDDATFRFAYTASFLKWALLTPGYKKPWHVGLRATHNDKRKLCAFISGIPITLSVRGNTFSSVEINFLCIHKKLRSKRLAPVLIKEVTRRCHLQGIWEAVYTAGVVPSKPIATCRYYHRSLSWLKLYETGFSPLPPGWTKQRMIMRNQLAETTQMEGIRLMEATDIKAVTGLLKKYLAKFDLAPVYSEEEVRHWFLHSGDDETRVIWAYVVEDPSTKEVTEFVSFYSLPSTVLRNPKHSLIRAAYLFHYATATPASPKTIYQNRLQELMQDALILASQLGFDVFNALTLLDNSLFLDELKFGAGDGHLNYYLFNYRAKPIAGGTTAKGQLDTKGSGVALVML